MRQLLFFPALAALLALALPAYAAPPGKIAQKTYIAVADENVTIKTISGFQANSAPWIPTQGMTLVMRDAAVGEPMLAKLYDAKDTSAWIPNGDGITAAAIGHGKLWPTVYTFHAGANVANYRLTGWQMKASGGWHNVATIDTTPVLGVLLVT